MTNCKDCRSHLSDLLLDDAYVAAHPELAGHLAACAACRTELAELRSTFALLDTWEAPEPSPFFDSRLHARLREAVAAEPEGFWERTRSFLLFSTGRQFRPAMTGALAFALLLGGGTFVTLNQVNHTETAASATVNDLKILDNNAQALQQMDQLLDESAPNTDDGSGPPTT
jgi:anti-sigma factor RsiW